MRLLFVRPGFATGCFRIPLHNGRLLLFAEKKPTSPYQSFTGWPVSMPRIHNPGGTTFPSVLPPKRICKK